MVLCFGVISADKYCKCPHKSPHHPQPVHAYPMEGDCTKYIDCNSKAVASLHNCPDGLHFSKKTLQCDNPENARCAPEYNVICEDK